MLRKLLIGTAAVVAALWATNTSLFGPTLEAGKTRLLSHRGVHQTFSAEDLENDTCTAERILPPTHDYIENTIPSMRAAFEHGAAVVELDVHLTPDGAFAVFHDWTLDCRTDGTGVTEETPMSRLKELDIGHGYTADGGRTFPLRGKGIGMIPALDEVFRAFPGRQFLINFKSQRADEGQALADLLNKNPEWRKATFGVYGGEIPTRESLRLVPGLRGYDKTSIISCLSRYLALGWSGFVPAACRNTLVIVPLNYAWMLWGWPHRFIERMKAAGSEVILMGPYQGGDFTAGIDHAGQLALVPDNFDSYVWTNRIEVIGPLLNPHGNSPGQTRVGR